MTEFRTAYVDRDKLAEWLEAQDPTRVRDLKLFPFEWETVSFPASGRNYVTRWLIVFVFDPP